MPGYKMCLIQNRYWNEELTWKEEVSFVPCAWLWEYCRNKIHTVPALRFDPWVRKIPWRREWQLTPVVSPGEFHGQSSLEGYSPWGHKESEVTEQLTLSLSLLAGSLHSSRGAGDIKEPETY